MRQVIQHLWECELDELVETVSQGDHTEFAQGIVELMQEAQHHEDDVEDVIAVVNQALWFFRERLESFRESQDRHSHNESAKKTGSS